MSAVDDYLAASDLHPDYKATLKAMAVASGAGAERGVCMVCDKKLEEPHHDPGTHYLCRYHWRKRLKFERWPGYPACKVKKDFPDCKPGFGLG